MYFDQFHFSSFPPFRSTAFLSTQICDIIYIFKLQILFVHSFADEYMAINFTLVNLGSFVYNIM